MATLVYALNQSLDGFVNHDAFRPDPVLFRHFVEDMRGLSASIYGRRMYEVMRYWDDDSADWDADERDFATAWRNHPKHVVSRTLSSVGPNATLVHGDVATAIRNLKTQHTGEIEVAGPELAGTLSHLDLIDVYRLYVHPVVLGSGKPFFSGPRPRLRLLSHERMSGDVIRLSYAPA